jgi:hypothetical protein
MLLQLLVVAQQEKTLNEVHPKKLPVKQLRLRIQIL